MEFAGRVVAVTGGARGIGAAIAAALAARGARVIVGDLEPDPGQSFVDVRSEESFASFVDSCGALDVLVNNAGVAVPGRLLDTTAAQQALQLEVNVHGVLRGMRLVLPGMLSRGHGHVVNIASAAGRIPAPNAAVYSASKHAVVALTSSLRSELLGTGVRVTAILPPVVRTEMSAGLRMRGLPTVSPEAVARAVVRVVSGRGNPGVVFVPRWVALSAAVDAVSPLWLRDLARRVASVAPPADSADRAGYDARVKRQLAHPPGTD
jgi:short-subunit dehydrogenase